MPRSGPDETDAMAGRRPDPTDRDDDTQGGGYHPPPREPPAAISHHQPFTPAPFLSSEPPSSHRFGSGTSMVPSMIPPGRNPSGIYLPTSGLPSLAPPFRQTTSGGGYYGEQVRSWGDTIFRLPDETATQHLVPTLRQGSEDAPGTFNHRLQLSLIHTLPEDDDGEEVSSSAAVPSRAASQEGPPPTRTRRGKKTGGASTVQGRKTIRLSVLPISGVNQWVNQDFLASANTVGLVHNAFSSTVSFTPKRLLDIENGTSILVTNQKFLDNRRYQELGDDGALVVTAKATAPIAKEDALFFTERGQSLQEKIQSGDIREFEFDSEVGIMGGAWRGTLRRLLLWALDDVNGLRFGRQLQLFLPFLTGYEAYLMSQIIEALDGTARKQDVDFVLRLAFKNRNVSRILVQVLGPRWDFFWHLYQQVTANRSFDAFGQVPFIGITSFPGTENFPATRNHAIASSVRVLLGEGLWVTRVLTQNRQGLNTDDPDRNVAQNLGAESNGFELANRNQFGTYFGRLRTNQFRLDHRLPTDESIVRTFVASPMATLVNNGVVHTLRQMAKHWHNTLYVTSGNFGHQRMEQIDPFETMRFHMPAVCFVLSSLRGRNRWDSHVLGPFIRKCQELKPAVGADGCRYLASEMREHIVANLTAGVASVYDPLQSWLGAILEACDVIQEEAKEVYQLVTSVEIGLRLGHDLITQVSWKIPSEEDLKNAILRHIQMKMKSKNKNKNPSDDNANNTTDGAGGTNQVSERRIVSALALTTPKDKRTLIELVEHGLETTEPAQLLLRRVKTLLQRDIRREALNATIRDLSLGEKVSSANLLVQEDWYWVEEGGRDNGTKEVFIYSGKVTGKDRHRFVHVDSGFEKFVSLNDGSTTCRAYVPVAESICRAQRCYMNIEVDHGKKFKYNAFMEFSFLRIALRRLAVISQVFCEELDNARLNVLREVQRSSNQTQIAISDMKLGVTYYTYDSRAKTYEPFVCKKEYTPADPEWQTLARTRLVKVPPQSMMVIGGGPAGLITVLHCTESVLASGGVMKLYEGRDAFYTGGSTFERAQVVRLDSRWIAMLRYYLGTGFEDVYIPASGETDAQLGNTIPAQGFVEITIKDLENMLHVEVSKMWSKGVIQCHTNSTTKYDVKTNALTKNGEFLKLDDGILRRITPDGEPTDDYFSWKVVDLIYQKPLGIDDLVVGHEYAVFVRQENAVLPFQLVAVNLESREYTFKALKEGGIDLKVTAQNLPSIYSKGTRLHDQVSHVVVESVQKGSKGGFTREELSMSKVKNQTFTMDIGHTHVVECIGKPNGSNVHFSATTYEPYGVCCISGLKISMGMHNFGEKRWGSGLLDDFRSTNDQNTRIIGDFTKMVRQPRIAEQMLELIKTENWKEHFKHLVAESNFTSLDELDPIMPKLRKAVEWHALNAKSFKRQTLQTRFFETGDNFYLGMEFTREYDTWKNETAHQLVASLKTKTMDSAATKDLDRFKGTLMQQIDRLWYEACLEIFREGDVYNPGARHRVPKLYTINSYTATQLVNLPLGESFRLADHPEEKYELVIKQRNLIVIRNVEGHISTTDPQTMVHRGGNLSRGPDGNAESKVALATFPVGHYVNYRTVRLNNEARGYVFAFIGDEQASPHFMRYSGLTGACINAMLFNNFVKQAIDGMPFIDRLSRYSSETNWCNSEVVTRGTGSNYGRDGFLRPGFAYKDGIDYLHSKVIEWMETGQDLNDILSRDWKDKFAASLVPRGMELNEDFMRVLYGKTRTAIFERFVDDVRADKTLRGESLVDKMTHRRKTMDNLRSGLDYDRYWTEFVTMLPGIDHVTKERLHSHAHIAKRLEQTVVQIVEFATKGYLYNERIVAGMFNQPKSVDSIVDDFAVEAQNFANSLVMSAALSAGALAFTLFDRSGATKVIGSYLGALAIVSSFGSMTNVSRYKIRNEEARILFFDGKLLGVLKAVFAIMSKESQDAVPHEENPFILDLDSRVATFRYHAKYYDLEDPAESGFNDAYDILKKGVNSPTTIREFQRKLTTEFIPDVYHVNSYAQEYLVDIFKVCSDMLQLLEQDEKPSYSRDGEHLFHRLSSFSPRLDHSLQRGHVYWGFLKKRRVGHWDIFVVFRYFWSLMFCASSKGTNAFAPIQTEIAGILYETRDVAANHRNLILRREIRDLEHLYWATRESDIASLIFVAAFITHMAAWIFTISRIITLADGPSRVTDAASYASVGSTIGAILAAFHFQRKFFILVNLWRILGGKVRSSKTVDDMVAIQKAKSVAFTQLWLTALRLLAAYYAAIALPWSVAVSQSSDQILMEMNAPFWIALAAVSFAILATILFFVVEYRVRYDLSPRLGEYVCEAFRAEIESMYTVLTVPMNDIDTKQEQERETWEYVAREFLHKYRFDTVFAADRFGSIFQYIQSGMDPRSGG